MLATRRVLQSHTERSLIVGCGSNVIDLYYPLAAIPKAGTKGYFANRLVPLAASPAGGVTLNHLAWAAALGAPTGLMALQGEDEYGATIRRVMDELGVSTEHVHVDPTFSTSVSHILLSESDGERAILMAPASSGTIDEAAVEHYFLGAVESSAMVTTEISQIPLSGVQRLLRAARERGVPSLLDVDVPPSVAMTEAELGDEETLLSCMRLCDVLKPTRESAVELLVMIGHSDAATIEALSTTELATQLRDAFDASLVAITDGSAGSALAVEGLEAVLVKPYGGVTQIDSTGAGDAYFGGMIASIHRWGLPSAAGGCEALERIGAVASAAGAACCETMGALPMADGSSSARMVALAPLASEMASDAASAAASVAATPADAADAGSSAAFAASIAADAEALATYAAEVEAGGAAAAAAVGFVATIEASEGIVFTSGMGKSGIVAQRMAAALASLSIPSTFVHASEWAHGELGSMRSGDAVVLFSNSGESAECVDTAVEAQRRGLAVLAITGRSSSSLGALANAEIVLEGGAGERELLGKVPSRSIVLAESAINGVLSAIAQKRGFGAADFKANHPGGAIGRAS